MRIVALRAAEAGWLWLSPPQAGEAPVTSCKPVSAAQPPPVEIDGVTP